MSANTKRPVMIGMLSAIAFVVVLFQIPIVMFLEYEAKDVIIAMGGFIYGPLSALFISIVVSLVELVTISTTGVIGCIMNILSTCSFACVAAYIYKKKHNRIGAVAGLLTGTVVMTIVMLLWNYLITPLYMGVPREQVAAMLATVFLPYNLVKGGLNMALTLLIYKPVVTALRKASLIAPSVEGGEAQSKENYWLTTIIILFLLATCIVGALVLAGKL